MIALAYTAVALWQFRHPDRDWRRHDRIANDWPASSKKLFSLGFVGLGCFFSFLAVYTAVTGRCL